MALLGVQGHRSVDLDFATNRHKNIKKMLKFAAANEPGGIYDSTFPPPPKSHDTFPPPPLLHSAANVAATPPCSATPLQKQLGPLKQVLSASRDVIISGQICGSKLKKVFTLGDGCWPPKLRTFCPPPTNGHFPNARSLTCPVPNMTGRPGYRTMEMNGGSSVSYLAFPCFLPRLSRRGENRRAFRLPGEGGDHFSCTVEPSPGHIRCRHALSVGDRQST